MAKLYGIILLVVLANLSGARATTTSLPSQDTTLEVEVTENVNKVDTTEGESLISDSTKGPAVDTETTSKITEAIENQTEAAKPVENSVCLTSGIQAHDANCQLYQECAGSADGSLQLLIKSCPEREAYNSHLGRCSRDISYCHPPVRCTSKGVIADPEGNTTYYLCQPRFTGSGFHIFRVYCGPNEVFQPSIGTCFASIDDWLANGFPNQDLNDNSDIATIKKEIKQLKKEYKDEIKNEKTKKKDAEKLEKEALKFSKEQKKFEMKARKLEAATFVCETQGNFPSQLGEHFYLACVNSKSKVIAVPQECILGAKFVPQTGTCERNSSASEDN